MRLFVSICMCLKNDELLELENKLLYGVGFTENIEIISLFFASTHPPPAPGGNGTAPGTAPAYLLHYELCVRHATARTQHDVTLKPVL